MSCRATKPLTSRPDTAFYISNPRDFTANSLVLDVNAYTASPNIDSVFKQIGSTPEFIGKIAFQTQRIVQFVNLNPFPILKSKFTEGSAYINPFELANMINVTGYNPEELFNELVSQQPPNLSNDAFAYLEQLEFYYDNYQSTLNAASKCDPLYKIWQAIVQIEILIASAQSAIARIKDWIEDLVAKLTNIETLIKEFLEKLAKRIRQRIKQLVRNLLAKLAKVGDCFEDIFQFIEQKANEIEQYFSDSNIEKIADDVGKSIREMFTPLNDFRPSNIAYILWRLCTFIESIRNLLTNPIAFFQTTMALMCQAQALIKAKDDAAARQAQQAGALRMTTDAARQRAEEVRDAIERDNASRGPVSITPSFTGGAIAGFTGVDAEIIEKIEASLDGVGDPNGARRAANQTSDRNRLEQGGVKVLRRRPYLAPTAEERVWVGTINREGSEYFRFSPSVQEMASRCRRHWRQVESHYNIPENERSDRTKSFTNPGNRSYDYIAQQRNEDPMWGDDDAGWKYIIDQHADVFIRLRRVVENLRRWSGNSNYRPVINSAYRSNYYNRVVLGYNTQMHPSGKALDIAMNNPGDLEFHCAFLYYAIGEGFMGTAIYPGFYHVDTRQAATTWATKRGEDDAWWAWHSWELSGGRGILVPNRYDIPRSSREF